MVHMTTFFHKQHKDTFFLCTLYIPYGHKSAILCFKKRENCVWINLSTSKICNKKSCSYRFFQFLLIFMFFLKTNFTVFLPWTFFFCKFWKLFLCDTKSFLKLFRNKINKNKKRYSYPIAEFFVSRRKH